MKGIFTALSPLVPNGDSETAVGLNERLRAEGAQRAFGPKALLGYPSNPFDLGRPDVINGLFDMVQGDVGFGGLIVGTNATDDGTPDTATLARLAAELKPALVVEMVDRANQIGVSIDGNPIFAFLHFCRVTPTGEVEPIQ